MSVVVDTVFNAGTYYIKIDGTGNTNVGEYGSLGSYTLSGINSPLPIHAISLSGTTDNKKHNLAWQVFSDEPVQAVVIESSTDGIAFNSLNAVAVSANQFSYTPFENSTIYYRLKINSLSGQIVYSNTVALKGITNADNIFKVSTLIQNEITVHAPAAYQYQISDINGRVVTKGNGTAGFNNISFYNQPGGMYIIQLYSKNQQQTERIIKQ
jgi:hypothetical protein